MVLHRSTVYINLISGITAGAAVLEDEELEIIRDQDRQCWILINKAGGRYNCPAGTLRILLDHAKEAKQYDHIEEAKI